MKRLIYRGLFLALVGIGVIGCRKLDSNTLTGSQNNTVKFESFEELHEKLREIEKMSEEERISYEKQNNLKSLLTYSYEIYEEIDMNNLEDESILLEHIKKHSDLLELIINAEGEKEYRPIYSDNRYSILAGLNRMIIVDSLCLKVFDDGIVAASIDFFKELESQNNKLASALVHNENYSVTLIESQFMSKSNCGNFDEDAADNNRNRTRLRIGAYTSITGGAWYGHAYIEIRPFMRTAWIWYHARRHITGSITSSVNFNNSGNMNSLPFNKTIPWTYAWVQRRDADEGPYIFGNLSVSFDNYNALGRTPSTGNATVSCN